MAQADEVAAAWNSILPGLPAAKPSEHWTEARVAGYLAVVEDQGYVPTTDEWRDVFKAITESRFLMGQTRDAFQCNLTWVLDPERVVSILEGKYGNHSA